MKKKGIVIKRVVEDRDVGIYVETDLLNKTIVIGKGTKRRRFALWEAERLEFLLRRQIDRINGNYPKEGVKEGNADVIKSSPSQTEIDEIQFEERMQSWLEKQHRLKLIDSRDQEKHKKMDSDGMEWFNTKEDSAHFVRLQGNILVAIEREEHSYQEVLRALDSIRNYYAKKGNDLLNNQSIQEVAKFGEKASVKD